MRSTLTSWPMAETGEILRLLVVPAALPQDLPAKAAGGGTEAWEGMQVLAGQSFFLQLTARSPALHPAISMLRVETEEILQTINLTIIRTVELEVTVARLVGPVARLGGSVERAAAPEPVALAGVSRFKRGTWSTWAR